MAEPTDAEIDAALARGSLIRASEPHATAARYDPAANRIVVDLTSGCSFLFPPDLVQGLETASSSELAEVSITPDGYALRWETLDVDYTVPGLLAGIFGTRAHMARLAGKARSTAKAEAARANGAKGGRPRRTAA